MLDESDYEDDPTGTAAKTGERIEDNASMALEELNRGPQAGEIEDAIDRTEMALQEIERQQESARDALSDLVDSGYGAGAADLAYGADEAYDLLEEIRGMSRAMVEGLVAADAPDEAAAEATIEIDGTEYRVRFDPLDEAEIGEPIDE